MNIGDRVHTPAGPATITRFHYEPMSLGVRNVRRLAFVITQTDDHVTHVFPPRLINQEDTMTTIEQPDPTTGEPDPTPPPPEPADDDDDTEKLIEWP